MFLHKSFKGFLMFFVHHFIRPIWLIPFSIAYFFISLFKYLFSKDLRIQYRIRHDEWKRIQTFNDLIMYFYGSFEYKWDGYKGAIDHHNFPIEFFMHGGDCDDVASYSGYKLKEISKKNKRYSKIRTIGIMGDTFKSWHYDTVYYDIKLKKYCLFNYGMGICCDTIQECIDEMSETWEIFPKNKTIYWCCFW